jgi:hypothetical protein
VAGAVMAGFAVGIVAGNLGLAPAPVTGQGTPMDVRVAQLETRVSTLETEVQDLSARPAPEPAPAAAAAAAVPNPVQTVCRDMRAESSTSSYTNGGNSTIRTTTNLNGVDGLTMIEFTDSAGAVVNYSIPTWLLDSYGGNYAALMRDLKDGLLSDRRSAAACRR